MQEVTIRLRFNRPCLGNTKRRRRRDTVFVMERDPAGKVMFMPSAWLSLMRYAAKLANRHQALVKKIDWDALIDGEPSRSDWRVNVNREGVMPNTVEDFTVHEAFQPGDVIGVNAVLPDGMDTSDFWALMTTAGTYRGFSPYNNPSEKFGTFEVLSVLPRYREWIAEQDLERDLIPVEKSEAGEG